MAERIEDPRMGEALFDQCKDLGWAPAEEPYSLHALAVASSEHPSWQKERVHRAIAQVYGERWILVSLCFRSDGDLALINRLAGLRPDWPSSGPVLDFLAASRAWFQRCQEALVQVLGPGQGQFSAGARRARELWEERHPHPTIWEREVITPIIVRVRDPDEEYGPVYGMTLRLRASDERGRHDLPLYLDENSTIYVQVINQAGIELVAETCKVLGERARVEEERERARHGELVARVQQTVEAAEAAMLAFLAAEAAEVVVDDMVQD